MQYLPQNSLTCNGMRSASASDSQTGRWLRIFGEAEDDVRRLGRRRRKLQSADLVRPDRLERPTFWFVAGLRGQSGQFQATKSFILFNAFRAE